MAVSTARYHEIYRIRYILFDYLESEKERAAVQALFDPKDEAADPPTISSLLSINSARVFRLIMNTYRDHLGRSHLLEHDPLKKRCAQDIAGRYISQFYDGLIPPSSLSICLLMSTEGGFTGRGDLSFITKLAQGLIQWGAKTTLVTNQVPQAEDLLKKTACRIISTKQRQEVASCCLQSDIVIEGPICSPAFDDLRPQLQKATFIQIREYGFSPISVLEAAEKTKKNLGFDVLTQLMPSSLLAKQMEQSLSTLTHKGAGPNYEELGVFVDRELYKMSHHFTRQANRLGRSVTLQQGISMIDCPCLQKALSCAIPMSSAPILYFGYGDENYRYFVELIAELESRNVKETRPVVICIVEKYEELTVTYSKSTPSKLPSISSELPRHLKKMQHQQKLNGFSTICFTLVLPRTVFATAAERSVGSSFALPKKGILAQSTMKGNPQQSKNLTVISVPYLSRDDMRTMQALAEDVVLCTGDQTTSEAFSTDKIWLYDLPTLLSAFPTHKSAFLDGMLLRANIELGDGQKCSDLLTAFVEKDTETAIALLQDKPLLLKQFKKLNSILRSKDLISEVTSLIQRQLVDHQSSSTAKETTVLTNLLVTYVLDPQSPHAQTRISEIFKQLGVLYRSLAHFEASSKKPD